MNETTLKKQDSKLYTFFTVLVGALLMGMLWRVRGSQGWSASWGLLNVGFVFVMFVVSILGGRKKLGLGWTSITVISFMLTVPAWGTLRCQISGILSFDYPDSVVYIPVFSAVVIMLCVGFGMAVIFGILIGKAFSDKPWKAADFVIVLAAFFIADLASKALFSHLIINLVQPQAAQAFEDGLIAAGEDGTAWHVYLKHFADDSWAKEIAYGRNYYATVKAFASAIRAAAAILATKFIVRDKRAARVGLVVCSAFAAAITAAEVFPFFSMGGWHCTQESHLAALSDEWQMWEYTTGFIAGGIITAVLIKMKPADDVDDSFTDNVSNTTKDIFTFIFGYIVLIGVNVVRPIFGRYDDSPYQIVYVIVASVISIVIISVVAHICGISGTKVNMRYFASFMLVMSVIYNFIVYMFIGTANYAEFHNIKHMYNILVTVSFAAVLMWGIPNFIGAGKEKYKGIKK